MVTRIRGDGTYLECKGGRYCPATVGKYFHTSKLLEISFPLQFEKHT